MKIKKQEFNEGFTEVLTNADKVKTSEGSSKKTASVLPATASVTQTAQSSSAPKEAMQKEKLATPPPSALQPVEISAQQIQFAQMSEQMRRFEEYEKKEKEQLNASNVVSIFNIKKHIQKIKDNHKTRKANKKDKFTRRLEREERRKRKPAKGLKKIPLLEKAVRFNPKPEVGLTISQVEQRMTEGYYNAVLTKTTKSYWRIFLGNIFTFFNLLGFAVAGVLIYVGSYLDTLFIIIYIANMLVSIIQEIKAKRVVERITLLTAPTACVIRDGKRSDIAIDRVVLDDVLAFSLGKQICADSIILSGEVEVNESLLTGESEAIKKVAGDQLFAGSFVSSGKCLARADKIGEYNYSSTLVTKAQEYKKKKSELLASVQLIVKFIAIIIVPLAILMYFNNSWWNTNATVSSTEAIAKTAGMVVMMIPAGMYLLTTMALALGVIKLARKRTLVQDLYSIEMLSRVDVICLDKTGTITDGTMRINSVIQVSTTAGNTVHDIIGSMLTALDDNNQTSMALAAHFGYSKELTPVAILPFSSSRKLSAVSFNIDGAVKTFAMGAPEFVLKAKDPYVDSMVKQYASKGFRVLVLASGNSKIEKDKLPAVMKPVAIIIIEDRIRDKAEETLKWFTDNGVGIKIISGDNPLTVSEVSKRVGVPNADKFISLEGLTKQRVVEAASKYTIFGRVSPEQKSILVRALKAEGKKVAMTGDGVNDILALKEADCSIAMASGSEAARNVSQVVLLDSNFASMPSIVAEGRRVINNISKSSALFLMKTFFAIFITIICLSARQVYPFQPIQILLLDFFIIGVPSTLLAIQPNKDPIKGNFLSNLISKALPGAILLTAVVAGCYIFNLFRDCGDLLTTMMAYALIFTGATILYRICKPFDLFRGILMSFVLLCLVLALTVVPLSVFQYKKLGIVEILVVVVFVQLAYMCYNSVIHLTDSLMSFFKKTRQNRFKRFDEAEASSTEADIHDVIEIDVSKMEQLQEKPKKESKPRQKKEK